MAEDTTTRPYTEVTEFLVWVAGDDHWEYSICWRTPDGVKKSEVIRLQPHDLDPKALPNRVIMAMYREKLWLEFEDAYNS